MNRGTPKVTVKGPTVQNFIKGLGLLRGGRVQTFIDTEVARLSDPFVPSDTTFVRKSVFLNTDFGSGLITYSIYGNPQGRNTYNDVTSEFQDRPKRGPYWVHRMFPAGGREKLADGIRRFLGGP